ncbi:MAG: hypothetical protein Q9227_003891 [Pyrenula ochraceoflavens]
MAESCGNPLLLEFLKGWMDEARERNSKGFITYKKAYESMKSCPSAFDHPSEAQKLQGIGPKLCDRLTEKLKVHCAANDLPPPPEPEKRRSSKRHSGDEDDDGTPPQPVKKPRKVKPYVPTYRSGGYALILGLATLEENAVQGFSKAETIARAEQYCDASFTAPSDTTKHYTAWNAMKTLLTKELVYEHGRPLRRYMLTDEGRNCASRLQKASSGPINTYVAKGKGKEQDDSSHVSNDKDKNREPSLERTEAPIDQSEQSRNRQEKKDARSYLHLISSSPQPSPERLPPTDDQDSTADRPISLSPSKLASKPRATPFPDFTPVILPPGSFTVHLLLDTREIRAKDDRDYISNELAKRGIRAVTRALPLGDALWIAKLSHSSVSPLTSLLDDGNSDLENIEIVLDHVLERKRLDDLISSIKDGRFHEQKFRLRRSGISNVIYLVENFTLSAQKADHFNDAVHSAIASTQVVNGYFVKRTQKLDDSIRYLARMTRMLKEKYESRPLHVIPPDALDARGYTAMQAHLRATQPDIPYYVTFSAFSSLTHKSSTLTLKDVYLKMLMCTRGVTGEKALEIAKHWKTPRELVEELDKREGGKKREEMVFEVLGHGPVPRRRIGKQLSGKVAQIWG